MTLPVDSPISQRFGERPEYYAQFGLPGHEGLDFASPVGTPVRAALGGTVVTAINHPQYGNYIEIDHGGGVKTGYAHLSQLRVVRGQRVSEGQIIGLSGNTGNSSAPHLHFNYIVNGQFQNPEILLNQQGAGMVSDAEYKRVTDLYWETMRLLEQERYAREFLFAEKYTGRTLTDAEARNRLGIAKDASESAWQSSVEHAAFQEATGRATAYLTKEELIQLKENGVIVNYSLFTEWATALKKALIDLITNFPLPGKKG